MTDDLDAVRGLLGPANPVPSRTTVPVPDLATVLGAGSGSAGSGGVASWVADTEPSRGRRRATVVTAVVGAAALVAAVAAVTIAGGGNGHTVTGGRSGIQVVAAAAAITEAAKTADTSVVVASGTTSLTVQGAADLTTGSADFTADLPASLGQIEIRDVGGVVYIKVPSGLAAMAGGKPWVKADPSVLGALGGARAGVPGLGATFDVTTLLAWLRSVSGGVTTVGTDTVHGDPTTHYRTTVDPAKAAASAPANLRAGLDKAAQAAGQQLPVDLWVDSSGRLRRFQTSFDTGRAALPTGDPVGTVQVTVEVWGFGAPVDVTAPPADQVGDLTGLLPAARLLVPQA